MEFLSWMWALTNYTAAGVVYNLKDLSDFAGNYVAAGAGITVAGGGSAVYLKNEHGVIIKFVSTEVGLKFNLSADGAHRTERLRVAAARRTRAGFSRHVR